jgi:NADH dehydrogenase
VIVGCGFAGLFAAKALDGANVDVTVIDRANHHLFQPLLYQMATGILSEGDIAPPIREVLRRQRNASVVLGEVQGVDLATRRLRLDTFGRGEDIPYDSLIVATGAEQSYFGHDEFKREAPGMKTLDDALELRGRIFGAFEMAELESDSDLRRSWLTFVVVGAGPTGVELAGQIAELAHRSLRHNFRRIDPASARVVLLDATPDLLGRFRSSCAGVPRNGWGGWVLRFTSEPWSPVSTSVGWIRTPPTRTSNASMRPRRSGPQAYRHLHWAGFWGRPREPRWIARDGFWWATTAHCRGTPRCSSSET